MTFELKAHAKDGKVNLYLVKVRYSRKPVQYMCIICQQELKRLLISQRKHLLTTYKKASEKFAELNKLMKKYSI